MGFAASSKSEYSQLSPRMSHNVRCSGIAKSLTECEVTLAEASELIYLICRTLAICLDFQPLALFEGAFIEFAVAVFFQFLSSVLNFLY